MFARARTKPFPKRPKKRIAEIKTLPPPTGGVNDRDALIGMPPTDAIRCENFICRPYGIEVRYGYEEFARVVTGSTLLPKVHSLLAYIPAFTPVASVLSAVKPFNEPFSHYRAARDEVATRTVPNSKLFAGMETSLYDVSAGGLGPFSPVAGPTAPVGTYWNGSHFTTLGGTFMCICPQEGGYWYYGTGASATWHKVVAGDGITADTIAGVDPALFTFAFAWKGRLWFVEKDSTRGWYLPPGQLYGVAQAYDFGTQFRRGGQLQVFGNWTQDAGDGIDDHLVAFSAEGDVSIYKGTDPTSTDTFALVGVWYVGPLPVGNRQVDPYGGDLHILSTAGLTMLSALIRFGNTEHDKVRRTSKINNSLATAVRSAQELQGWQVRYLPQRNLIMILAPFDAISRDVMIVQDVNTAGWSVLYDHPASSYVLFDGVPYFGSEDGSVVHGFTGALDDIRLDDPSGLLIGAVVVPANNNLDKPGLQKIYNQIRIAMLGSIPPELSVTALVDYNLRQETFTPTLPRTTEARWDVAEWDIGVWSGGYRPLVKWFGIAGNGFVVTPQMEFDAYGGLVVTQYDWLFQTGGPLG